jgi:prepilin-type N-terminal cleavage/methylation domain-containing protein
MFRRSEKGFTLVELMIVVVIIGILASIAIPKFSAMISKAKSTEAKSILNQIISLEVSYYYSNSTYAAFDNIDVPAIDFQLPANAKFDYKFVDNGDGTGLATATENVDLNGDGDITDGLTLDTDKNRGNLDDGGGSLLMW